MTEPTFPSTQLTIIDQGIAISFNLAVGLSLVASLSDDALFDIVGQVKKARSETKHPDAGVTPIHRKSGKHSAN